MELKVGYGRGPEEVALGQSCLRQRGEGSDGGKDGRLSQLSDLYLEDEEDVPQAERVADTRTEEETEEERTRTMHYVYAAISRNRASLFLRRHGILPPKGRLSQLLTRVLVVLLWFGVTWAILGDYVHHAPINLDTSPSRGSCDVGSSVTEVNTSNVTNGTSFNLTAPNSTTKSSTCQMEKIDSLASLFWEYAVVSGPDSAEELSTALDGGEDNCSGSSVSGQCVLREAVQAVCPEPENNSARLSFFDIEKGHFFGLIVLGIVAAVAGYLVSLIRLPPLLGMLIAGVVLNNIPYIAVTRLINPNWSSVVRSIALTVILTRGGIAMDAGACMCTYVCMYVCLCLHVQCVHVHTRVPTASSIYRSLAVNPSSCLEEEPPSCVGPWGSPLSGRRWNHSHNYGVLLGTEVAVGSDDWVSAARCHSLWQLLSNSMHM